MTAPNDRNVARLIDELIDPPAEDGEGGLARLLVGAGVRLVVALSAMALGFAGAAYATRNVGPSSNPVARLVAAVEWWPFLLSFLFYLVLEAGVVGPRLRQLRSLEQQRRVDLLIREATQWDATAEALTAEILPMVSAPVPWQRIADRIWKGAAAWRQRRQQALVEQRVATYLGTTERVVARPQRS